MLELRGITAGYGSHVVLRDVSLAVPDGTVVALVGANGAGKTTLLRAASGLIRPKSGQVVLDGVDVTRWAPERRVASGLCHVPEGRGVFGSLTVADNLVMQGAARSASRSASASSRYAVLADRLAQRASTLSGGEQQMLALARLERDTVRLALVDEVSMGLAPALVDDIYTHLHELAAAGVALLVVEQHVHRVLELADHVYVIRRGSIVFAGEPGQLHDDRLLASYLGGSR